MNLTLICLYLSWKGEIEKYWKFLSCILSVNCMLFLSFRYEDDPIIGHRLYRESRHVEMKQVKGKSLPAPSFASYQWETVATNLDEFQEVSDKLFSSKNRTEVALGKRLKNDILPEIEKIHKRKERALKKQHRQALLLDTYVSVDGLSSGRSLRDRKPVTYTFDDYDRSITEAIKITKKKQNSPEHVVKKEIGTKPESSPNGKWNGTSKTSQQVSDETLSPKSNEYEESDGEEQAGSLDRSNRSRKRPQRYSEKDFVEAVSGNEADFDSDDDIVGEAVYDEEYLRSRKQKKVSSSSEGDEEYREENAEEEEDEEDSLSTSDEDTDEPQKYKKPQMRNRRGAKLRSVGELQSGLRRSKRATRPRIDYRQYQASETDAESEKPEKSNASDAPSGASNDMELSTASHDSENLVEDGEQIMKDDKMNDYADEPVEKEQCQPVEKIDKNPGRGEGVRKRRYLDLNQLAPGIGFEDGPNSIAKDEDTNNL
ncbi:DDT domain-containing protein DDR4 [Iris pallida]|uniref:DDT domain-containing protein DDR4 n=1 Tax=Iris pallida TaxID=29817 RepID=A0AAX6HFX6_IRIPA|nr:DDT domain-containing protein DDR4 [Iris pallida]KAJ6839632.1 DDT domain-containing protein DDR4 [Iris pallida]